jgi:hypothetical protein
MRTLATLTYKEKEYDNIMPMLKAMVKDEMSMDKIRNHLIDLGFDEDEVDFIMSSYYSKIIVIKTT